jgi:hypothetical protein
MGTDLGILDTTHGHHVRFLIEDERLRTEVQVLLSQLQRAQVLCRQRSHSSIAYRYK